MAKSSNATTGQIIRRIRTKEFAPVYSLFGGDAFLEDFFMNELSKTFLNKNGKRQHFSLDYDKPEYLFLELSSISLFKEKKIIIVREIKKLKSEKARNELYHYIKNPNYNIVLILISDMYDMKNTFLKKISTLSQLMDFRPPFENEMKQWISYVLQYKKIKVKAAILEEYIQLYGDSIAHVINEIEKTALELGEYKEINENNQNKGIGVNRIFHLWQLQDELGNKNLSNSLNVSASLLKNGNKLTGIIISLVFLYKQLLWKKMGRNLPMGYTGINKIITSRLKKYDKLYTKEELLSVLQDLRKLDLLSKSISMTDNTLLQPLIIKICKGQYV